MKVQENTILPNYELKLEQIIIIKYNDVSTCILMKSFLASGGVCNDFSAA